MAISNLINMGGGGGGGGGAAPTCRLVVMALEIEYTTPISKSLGQPT